MAIIIVLNASVLPQGGIGNLKEEEEKKENWPICCVYVRDQVGRHRRGKRRARAVSLRMLKMSSSSRTVENFPMHRSGWIENVLVCAIIAATFSIVGRQQQRRRRSVHNITNGCHLGQGGVATIDTSRLSAAFCKRVDQLGFDRHDCSPGPYFLIALHANSSNNYTTYYTTNGYTCTADVHIAREEKETTNRSLERTNQKTRGKKEREKGREREKRFKEN